MEENKFTKGIEKAEKYALGKSSSNVFQEAHKKDYLTGYNQAIEDSCANEMLEMLQSLLNESDDIVHIEIKKSVLELIKKATEL